MPPDVRTRVGDDAHGRNLAEMTRIIEEHGFDPHGATVRDEGALETIFFTTARLDPGGAIVLSDADRLRYVQSLYTEAMSSSAVTAFRAKLSSGPQAGAEKVFAPRAPGRTVTAAAPRPDPWRDFERTAVSRVRALVAREVGVDPSAVRADISINYNMGPDGRVSSVSVRLGSVGGTGAVALGPAGRSNLEGLIGNELMSAASGRTFGTSTVPVSRPIHLVTQS